MPWNLPFCGLRSSSGNSSAVAPAAVWIDSFTFPGLAFFATINHTNACFPSGCICVFSILTPGCEIDIFASLRSSPYSKTITGETKLVHQFGGSTLLICGGPAAAARPDSDRMAITRTRMTNRWVMRGNLGLDIAVPRGSIMSRQLNPAQAAIVFEPQLQGKPDQAAPGQVHLASAGRGVRVIFRRQ